MSPFIVTPAQATTSSHISLTKLYCVNSTAIYSFLMHTI